VILTKELEIDNQLITIGLVGKAGYYRNARA
jgi:hypothetical protein